MRVNIGKNTMYVLMMLAVGIVIVYFYPHNRTESLKYEEGRPWNYAKLIAPFDVPIRPDSLTIQVAKDSLDRHFVPAFVAYDNVADTVIADINRAIASKPFEGSTPKAVARYRTAVTSFVRDAYRVPVLDSLWAQRLESGTLPNVRLVDGNTSTLTSTNGYVSVRGIERDFDSVFATDTMLVRLNKFYDLSALLRPSLVYNNERSTQLYDYDMSRITAVRGVILQGQTIIDKGTIISPQDYTNIKTYEQIVREQRASADHSFLLMWCGQGLYVLMLLLALGLYIRFYAPKIWRKPSAMVFILSLVTLFFLAAVFLNYFLATGIYLVPFVIVPILVLVFFEARTAMFVSVIEIMLCAGLATFALEFVLLQFCATCAAVFSLRTLSRRSELLRASAMVCVAYLLAYIAEELMLNGSFDGFSWRLAGCLVINSLLTSMAYIMMFAAERLFGLLSIVRLVELCDINTPLLRRLSDECPGTFQHSMAVSTLASDAAARVGCNVPLVRAGALYHDIGKLNNPAFFTENQHGVNPHDGLSPERSARIIIDHVLDGMRIADRAGIPAPVKDFIRQHHGKGTTKYFYYKYLKDHPDCELTDPRFCYPGPNPTSREASILMMADAVEAASRSLKEHTAESISRLVNDIIDTQIADGMHNSSSLSFKDVQAVKEAFVKRLHTLYHSRVAYPSGPAVK